MFGIFTKSKEQYPREFWFLFWGVFINRISASMIWPFLTLYMYKRLDVPLATVTMIMMLPAFFGIASTTIVSSIMDKVGRKWAMIAGLVGSCLAFLGMAYATTLPFWIILIAVHGTFIPIFNIGVNVMVADLIEPENRTSAYALIRTVSNAGIGIGPVLGGILSTISIEVAFLTTSLAYVFMIGLAYFFLPETKPETEKPKRGIGMGDYLHVLRDKRFIVFIAMYFLIEMAYSHIFNLLSIYVNVNFGLPENQYSLIVIVNAVMVVLFQYIITKYTRRYNDFSVIVAGSLLYGFGLLSVAFGSVLWHFMLSMAILTLGELFISPTATTLVANMAPENLRARYLGLLSLGYSVGAGFGPVIGGYLNDTVSPAAIWYGAATMAACGALGYFILAQVWEKRKKAVMSL